MELDHIFLFVKDEATARGMMQAAGLRVNYSRTHPGQGTRNLCACLEDMYFELLWLDGSPISQASEQISLGARARGDGLGIGMAWRGEVDVACFPYAAPFLPSGVTIPVAKVSLDSVQPFVFQSPGGTPPIHGDKRLVGQRQRPIFTRLRDLVVRLPNCAALPPFIHTFERVSFTTGRPGIDATMSASAGYATHHFSWP